MTSPRDLQQQPHRHELTIGQSSNEQAFDWLNVTLGDVAPRDPITRRLLPRRSRLQILADTCDRETFHLVTTWLGSDAVPSVQSKRGYADDLRMWADVARELGRHEKFFVGSVTSAMVGVWVKTQRAKGRSPRSINRRLAVLSSLTEYAAWYWKREIISPVTKHDRLRVDPLDETTATPILEKPEFQSVVSCASTPRQALVPVLIYTLAGRVTESCQSRLDQIHQTPEGRVLDLRRKGGKGRVWPLNGPLCGLIDAATAGRTSGPLLLDDAGLPMDRHMVLRLLGQLGRQADVMKGRSLTPHALRASRLTHMHDDGVPVEEIQEYANHAMIETTLRYIRRREESKRRAAHAAASVEVYGHLLDRFSVFPQQGSEG